MLFQLDEPNDPSRGSPRGSFAAVREAEGGDHWNGASQHVALKRSCHVRCAVDRIR